MPSRTLRAAALFFAAVVLLTACEITVGIQTDVEADGSGSFSLDIVLDKELLRALQQAASVEGSDLSSLEAMFDGLASVGWVTSRTQPAEGLRLTATRSFADPADFDRVLAELGGADGGTEGPVDLGSLDVDFDVRRSLLRTESSFSGRIDLSFGEDIAPVIEQLQDVLAQTVHFEVRASLPGEAIVTEGGGSVTADGIVWRPAIGSQTSFAAEASQWRAGPLLAIILPGIALLALLAWFLMGRRPRDAVGSDDGGPKTEPVVLDV